MTDAFLERNKKKGLLAALLLFLRQRKMQVALLLLVLAASTVFLSPSSWITRVPGGDRFAAGMAWAAGRLGLDVSKWGLGAGRQSYDDLLAAFRAARAEGGGAGWGPFFRREGSGAAPNSLDFVKGSRSDLDQGSGVGGFGRQSVAGIVDPSDPKKGGDGVSLSEEDLGGQREDFMKEAFAGGAPGYGVLSGGAYATKGFFKGEGAADSSNALARAALAGLPPLSTPPSTRGGAAKGSLTAMASNGVEARAMQGASGAGAIGGNSAYTQLVEGHAQTQLGTTYCLAPGCPAEYAATNTGAIYDGSDLSFGFLTSSDPNGAGVGLTASVDIPPQSDLDSDLEQSDQDAAEAGACESDAMQCEQAQQSLAAGFTAPQNEINLDVPQLPGACNQVCSCGACDALNADLTTQCTAITTLSSQISSLSCNMPGDCSALGIATPSNVQNVGGACPTMACNKCPTILGVCICF